MIKPPSNGTSDSCRSADLNGTGALSWAGALGLAAILALAALNQGCSIHPPDDFSNMGPEVSVEQINQVLAQAQSGVTQTQAFHVGDTGTEQIVDTIMGSFDIRETNTYQVTSIDSQNINYIMHQVDSDTCYEGQIPLDPASGPTPTPTPNQAGMSTLKHGFSPWAGLSRMVAYFRHSLSHLLSRVQVEPSTALGGGILKIGSAPVRDPRLFRLFQLPRPRKMGALKTDDTLTGPVPCAESSPTPTPSPSSSPSSSPSTSPSPEPSPTPVDNSGGSSDNVSHQYFKLSYYTHRFQTSNCAQLSDCKVNATHIDYDEIQTDTNGNSNHIHWMYEISTQVPGLFFVMQQCFSTLVVQNGQVLPLTRCQNVSDFRYGSPSM